MSDLIGMEQSQEDFWGNSYDKLIPNEHLARKLVSIFSTFPLHHFKVRTAPGGKSQYHPLSLLALICFCFIRDTYSSRLIVDSIVEWCGSRYIMSGRKPHHSVICNFIKDNRSAIITAFVWFLKKLNGLGLVQFAHIIGDGTKMSANAALHNTVKYCDVDKEIKKSKKKVKELMQQALEILRQLENLGKKSKAAKSLRGKFIATTKKLAYHENRIEALEVGRRNLEEEARELAVNEIRREMEESVLIEFFDDVKAIDQRSFNFKAAKDRTDADFSRLKREVSKQHAKKETRKRYQLLEQIGRHIAGDWAILKPEIEGRLNAVCRVELDSEEVSRRAKKLLPPDRKLSTTDPDSRVMRMANKSFDMAYNNQLAIDKSSNMALCIRVTRDRNDMYQLRVLVKSITENLGPVKKADADSGYHFGHELDVMEALGIDLCVPANKPDSKYTKERWKLKRTEQARKMEKKLELEEYKRRSGDRKIIESKFGNTKFNDKFTFIYYRGLEMVEVVITLKYLSQNIESYVRHERRIEEEKKKPKKSVDEILEAKFVKALDRFNRLLARKNPRQPSLLLS